MNRDSIILYVGAAFSLLINLAILQYLQFNEENCNNCTENREHQILGITTYLMFGVIALRVLTGQKFKESHPVLLGGVLLVSLTHFITLYRYISEMLVPDCKGCTDEWQRPLLYYYTRIMAVLFGIVGVVALFAIGTTLILPRLR